LLNPNYNQTFAGVGRVTSNVHTTANTFGVYALDTMRLGEYVELSGGVRFDIFDAHYEQNIPPKQNFSRLDTMPTYRGAIVYKPKPYASAYFAYGTSFNPSAEGLSLTAGNANVPPEETQSFEFGTKWQLFAERLLLEGALFKVEKTNARVTDPNNPLLVTVSGSQQVYGFELDATGNIMENWQVFGGYVYLSSKVESSLNPLEVGNRLANAPTNNFILWSTYGIPQWKTTIGGGLNYYSSRNASTIPNAASGFVNQAPGYVTVQGMLKYQLTRNIALQTNIYNITNAYYFQDLHPAHVIPGEGTMALFSTIFNF
jgi:catecholate siderophore receptor